MPVAALEGSDVVVRNRDSSVLSSTDIRVRVAKAGVNYWEVMQQLGRVPQGPGGVLGTEGAGEVLEVGADVDDVQVGARVAWSKVPGRYADEVTGPRAAFQIVPDGVDDNTAAGVLFQGVTAHYLAVDAWPLTEGDTAVVTAAAGGVGLLLVQLLKDRGVRVIGMVGSREKMPAVTDAGASDVLTYDAGAQGVRELVSDGVNAVFDSVGGELARDLTDALKVRGAMVLYGAASGEEAGIVSNSLGRGSFYVTRTAGRDYARTPDEASFRASEVLRMAAAGTLRVTVADTWPLSEAGEALAALSGRATVGKALIDPTV